MQIGKIDSLGWLGRFDEATQLADHLETTLDDLGAHHDAAKALVNRASLDFRRDRAEPALAAYLQAAERFARADDPISAARVDANAANVLTQLQRIPEALARYASARGAFADAGLDAETARVDANVGFLHFASGELSRALSVIGQGQAAFARLGRPVEVAGLDLDLGETYRALNLWPEAQAAYERASAAFSERGIGNEAGRAALGLAAVAAAQGDAARADAALADAAARFHTEGNRLQSAHVRLLQAHRLRQGGVTDAAVRLARSAARAFTREGRPDWAAEARLAAWEWSGDRSSRTPHAVARIAEAWARGWLLCRAHTALGRLARDRGRLSDALRHFRTALDALESARTGVPAEEHQVAFLDEKLGVVDALVEALLTRGRPGDLREALQQVERVRSRLLLERLQAAADATGIRNDPELTALRAELSRRYRALHGLPESGGARRATPGGADLAALEARYSALLSGGPSERRASPSPPQVERLQAALADDESLLAYVQHHETISAFVVTRRSLDAAPGIARLSDIQGLARRLRFQLRQGAGAPNDRARCDEANDVLARLYDLLLRPVADRLRGEKVVALPYGALHGLPFHALRDGGAAALDRWEFALSPSAGVWLQGRLRAPGAAGRRPGLVLAVPSPGIEHVAEEARHVADALPGATTACGSGATIARFLSDAPGQRILHLATHAVFRADNPLFSGLQLSDGWLLARDLYGLRLDADLATLSACATGVSSVMAGDELFGLTRGFLAAGVRSLAVSLWAADDSATAALMADFYSRLRAGQSASAALRAAQSDLRERFPHPYHWAPFVVVGERNAAHTGRHIHA